MTDDKKQDETTAVAKKSPLSMVEQRKENEAHFQDPATMVRAAASVVAKSQWGHSLTLVEVQAFESVAQANGVSLTNGTAYVLGGNLYISLQGRLKMAHESGVFGGFSVDRTMTDDERKSYSIKDGEFAWISTAKRFLAIANTVQTTEYTDFGRASTTEKNPVAKSNPLEMAMKRARARALKLAFPCGLGSVEECGKIIDISPFDPVKDRARIFMEDKKAELQARQDEEKKQAFLENSPVGPTASEVAAEMKTVEEQRYRENRTTAIMEGQDPDVIPKPGEPELTDEELDAKRQAEYDAKSDAEFEAAQKSEGEKGAK